MSGSNPFSGLQGGNGLMPPRPTAPAPSAPRPGPFRLHHARVLLAHHSQEEMIKKRDTIGEEMTALARVANAPENNRADIVAHIGGLVRKGQVAPQEAAMMVQALPEDQDGIRQWARVMFNAAMQAGIHAHAAYPRELFPGETPPEPAGSDKR